MKQKRRTKRAGSQTKRGAASSPSAAMNYLLEKISAVDMMKLWDELKAYAKVANGPTTLGGWASGTISGPGCQAAVTAYITEDGFVLYFTARGMSIRNGAKDEKAKS